MEKIPIKNLDKYMFVDPAAKKKHAQMKRARARQAIVIIGIDYLTRIHSLLAWAGHLPASAFRDKIISVYSQWNPSLCGIEANGMQELYGEMVYDHAKEKLGFTPKIIPIYQPTKIDKDFRIRTILEPVLNTGRLIVPDSQIELRSELEGFPTARTKDLVDALASAIDMCPRRPKQETQDSEIQKLAAFLRNSGPPAGFIGSWSNYVNSRIEDLTRVQKSDKMLSDIVPSANRGRCYGS